MLDDISTTPKQKPGRRADAAKHREIIEMYEGGVRDITIFVEEVGLSPATIRRVLKEAGKELSREGRSPDDVEGIIKDYLAEMPIKQLLPKWNIAVNTLYTILQKEGIEIRRNQPGMALRKAAAVELFGEGVAVTDIKQETGLSTQTIYTELERSGVERKRSSSNTDMVQAIQMYEAGIAVADINVETGVSYNALYRELRIRQIPKRGHNIRSDSAVDRAVEMYLKKIPVADIYFETHVGAALLYRVLRVRGLSLRGHGSEPPNMDRAVEMYLARNTWGEIYDETRVNSTTLRNELRERGIELRP